MGYRVYMASTALANTFRTESARKVTLGRFNGPKVTGQISRNPPSGAFTGVIGSHAHQHHFRAAISSLGDSKVGGSMKHTVIKGGTPYRGGLHTGSADTRLLAAGVVAGTALVGAGAYEGYKHRREIKTFAESHKPHLQHPGFKFGHHAASGATFGGRVGALGSLLIPVPVTIGAGGAVGTVLAGSAIGAGVGAAVGARKDHKAYYYRTRNGRRQKVKNSR